MTIARIILVRPANSRLFNLVAITSGLGIRIPRLESAEESGVDRYPPG